MTTSSRPARMTLALALLAVATAASTAPARSEETYQITIRDHRFTPAAFHVVAGQRVKLVISNTDATPETFDSEDFGFERLIAPGSTVTIFLGPLEPGTYSFFGELNPETAQGLMTAR